MCYVVKWFCVLCCRLYHVWAPERSFSAAVQRDRLGRKERGLLQTHLWCWCPIQQTTETFHFQLWWTELHHQYESHIHRFHNCKCTQMFNCCLKTDLYQSFSFSSAYSLLHHSAPPRTNFINSLICMLYQDLWIDGHCNENEHFLQLMQPYRHPAKIKLVIRKLSSVSNVSTSGKVWTYSACMSLTPIKHFKYLS